MTPDGAIQQPLDSFPKDINACHALIQFLQAQHQQLLESLQQTQRENTQLHHRLDQLLRKLYGRSREKLDPNQMLLFADLLQQLQGAESALSAAELNPAAPRPAATGHGRRRLPMDLPRQTVVHDLPEMEKPCPCCGTPRTVIGKEVSEQLDFEPAKLFVVEHVRLKYVCPRCERLTAEGGPQIETAEKPLWPIEKGLAAPGLLAYVLVSKYGDHLPLHRLEKILQRHNIQISRSTMCDWAAQSAQALKPLYDRMIQEVLASKVIHTDDTPVRTLDRQPGQSRIGRFWVYLGDRNHPQTVFAYTPSRNRDGPMNFLRHWGQQEKRYLQADAFGGYDGIYAGQAGGQVTEVACWAHARRKFYEARNTDPAVSTQALAYIRMLYNVEDRTQELSSEERTRLRQEQAAPILKNFEHWLHAQQVEHGGTVLPRSPLGQAFMYAFNQWEALGVYTTDGDLAIDNNAAENALRRVALGRKNWLFCGSDAGGQTAAILFSLIATCQRHQTNPFTYLRDTLTRIAAHPITRLTDLLPNHWQSPAIK
jgi:transposase